MSKTIEQIVNNQIEQIASKQTEMSKYQISYIPSFKAYLDNIPTPSMSSPVGIIADKKISISTTNQSADTNRTNMEHISLLKITIV